MSSEVSSIFVEKKVCPNPFLTLEVGAGGDASVCCTGRLKPGYHYVGNILENTLDEIWDGEAAQEFRRIAYSGEYEKSCESFCPQLIALNEGKTPPFYSNYCEADTRADIEEGKIILDASYKAIAISSDGSCNLTCLMCRGDRKTQATELEKKVNDMLYAQILDNIEKIRNLQLTGNGDPFFNKDIARFLRALSEKDISKITLRFITNGQLLNEKRFIELERLNAGALRIGVSIDAATKDTYESIRRGGKWKTLSENMKMLAKKRAERKIEYLQVTFVVMKRNIDEMIPFIKLAKAWNCDRVDFQRMMHTIAGLENIFDFENPRALRKLSAVLQDPIFSDTELIGAPFESLGDYRWTIGKELNYIKTYFTHQANRVRGRLISVLRRLRFN